MREHPIRLLDELERHVQQRDKIVISAITYSELKFGAIGKKASPKHGVIVNDFMSRVDSVLAWDRTAVDETTLIKQDLAKKGTPIGSNDAAIAGHAIAAKCTLITNNVREFERVEGLAIEDWSIA